VITDLTRRLQPVIPYSMGDVGEWVDYKEEIFRPRGRDSVGVKIGTTMELTMLRAAVAKTLGDKALGLFQVVVRRTDVKNEMIFRLVKDQDEPEDHEAVAKELQRNMEEIRPQFKKHVADGIVQPLRVEWVTVKELHFNARTGKLKDTIDERY
jgi:phenylacetate-CoA ligase